MADKIKTNIQCLNIAPIENLTREISSNSLKFGVFANNGSGKTFISRLFRLTEKSIEYELETDGSSPTDKLISIGKDNGSIAFKIVDKEGNICEDFKIEINKGQIPILPTAKYLYHTFNQDYVEENIRALSYEKDSEIEGFILGKVNIDLKDDEEKLAKIEKEGKDLSQQIEKDVSSYLEENINDIRDIKRLGDYKILEYSNIVNSIDNEAFEIGKTFGDLLEDYNKIKSVPENLNDIIEIAKISIDLNLLNELKENCAKEYSLSSLAEDFKLKIKEKQDFVEIGMSLISENNNTINCPFCEQELKDKASELIDNYTKYINDTEAKTIKQFKTYIETINNLLLNLSSLEGNNSKRINEYNTYKTKYIPSCEEIELVEIDISPLKKELAELISILDKKSKNIDIEINIDNDLIQSIEKNQTILNGQIETNNNEIKSINAKKNRIGEENKSVRRDIIRSAFNHLIETHKTNIKSTNKLRNEYQSLKAEIKKKQEQQKVSKKDKVASTIKTVLNYFFAEKYTLDEETFRLIFHKNILEKNQAKNILSEGEKNIVAFAYYIGDTHLKIDSEDDYTKLFFIIDDPISSMDFSHVYTLCGVIRDIGKIIDKIERERLLIFTHNNDFMRVLASNNIVDKKLLLKNGELKDFNNNLTVPYINHLIDIYKIARKGTPPNHTTANSIRHIVETLTKFERIDISTDSIAEYIKEYIPTDTKSYTLINDLSHGGWRTEQAPITDEDYTDICETILKHIEKEYNGQVEYCKKICD